MAEELSDFDGAHFRAVLGHFPTGVTIVTALADGERPIGFTVGSFMSISLDPPLVGFLAMHDSETWMAMAKTDGILRQRPVQHAGGAVLELRPARQ